MKFKTLKQAQAYKAKSGLNSILKIYKVTEYYRRFGENAPYYLVQMYSPESRFIESCEAVA